MGLRVGVGVVQFGHVFVFLGDGHSSTARTMPHPRRHLVVSPPCLQFHAVLAGEGVEKHFARDVAVAGGIFRVVVVELLPLLFFLALLGAA